MKNQRMHHQKRFIFLFLLPFLASALYAQSDLSGEDILKKVDANAAFASISYTGVMEISIGGTVRRKEMRATALGSSKAFVEFVNPEDRGTRYLKVDKNLWMYFPGEQETVKISGHLLKEGMMGSDVSYEDALESDVLYEKYRIALSGRESLGGRDCYVVKLEARVKSAPYDKRVMWIDSERFVSLKEEMYAKSGKLLKVSSTEEVKRIGNRWFVTRLTMENKLRKDTKTVFTLGDVTLDAPVDDGLFSMRNLSR